MTVVLRGVVDPTTSTDPGAPLLVLGPSIGTDVEGWHAAARLLARRFRVIRLDLPGHGLSPAATGPVSIADVADGVVALVDSLGGGRFLYAGVSIGGTVGIELAVAHADRLAGLAILCSDARIGEPASWAERAEQVRRQGTPALVAASSARWFAPSFPARDPGATSRTLHALMDADDESYARLAEALGGFDRRAEAAGIHVLTLVVAGEADGVVTPYAARALAETIPGSGDAVVLADTGHPAHIERPEEVARLLLDAFSAPADPHTAGAAVRRQVLGDAHVDRATAGITPETAAFQRYITEAAWGAIWTRDGIPRTMRSAVTISALVAGHHWDELAMHLRAGLTNGLTRDELAEILLTTAVYAGVPSANSAFGVLKAVLAEQDGKD